MVLGVFEVRARRAECLWRDPGEPEAEGPKGWCLQDTPDITSAFSRPQIPRSIQMETKDQRTFQMDLEIQNDEERQQGR